MRVIKNPPQNYHLIIFLHGNFSFSQNATNPPKLTIEPTCPRDVTSTSSDTHQVFEIQKETSAKIYLSKFLSYHLSSCTGSAFVVHYIGH